MKRLWVFSTFGLIVGAFLLLALEAHGADFKSAKRQIQTGLRSKEPADRVAALRELSKYHEVEAARLALTQGLKSADADVRRAVYETLLAYRDDQEVADFLFTFLKKQKFNKANNDAAFLVLATLLSTTLAATDEKVFEYLDQQANTPQRGGVVLAVTLAEHLGLDASKLSLPPLLKLSKAPLFDREFGVRRTIVHALTQLQEPAAIDVLIDLLARLEGEVQADIGQYLTELTGQQFDVDAKLWLEWWKKNRETFRFTSIARADTFRQRHVIKRQGSYYGLPLYAQRLVFVLDTSGSMRGERLVAAKRELVNAIQMLRETDYFSVLVFNSGVTPWQRDLMPATVDSKEDAARFVQAQQTAPMTASYNALEAALRFDAEAIYFLSDGAPFGGKITNPPDIIAAITQLNQPRKISIYTIGIGVGEELNRFSDFLQTLAEKNLGAFRRVNE